jgi:hypothetical protein
VAAVARGSPSVQIVIFKHSDCKFHHLYGLNLVPELQNPATPELNQEQKYTKFPCDVKLSMDCVFLAVTLCSGEVKLLKMPPILNPMEPLAPAAEATPTPVPVAETKGSKKTAQAPQAAATIVPSVGSGVRDADSEVVRSEIDRFAFKDLPVQDLTINTFAARKRRQFIDPFVYVESTDDTENSHQNSTIAPPKESVVNSNPV